MSRWTAAIAALVLLPVVVVGAAVGAFLPGVGVGPIPAGGALGLAAAARQAGFAGQALRMAVAVGLAVVTQDAADLLASDLGQAVVANAATQILLSQAPQAIDQLADAFHLSHGERQYLLAAGVGEGILAAGTERMAFRAQASPAEHALVTTDPAELADLEAAGR